MFEMFDDQYECLQKTDSQVADLIEAERKREEEGIELIASENFVSKAVMAAQGCVMTNKYAEGYPGARYYGGCEVVDQVEELARARARVLFGAEHTNVQPHSGSQANMGVYFAVLNPGDTILAMNLNHGGHLTHGSSVNFSGKLFTIVSYGVDPKTECIDFDEVRRLARECKPKMIVCGASAYPRTIDSSRFKEIADEVGAMLMFDVAHIAGLIAGKAHLDPVPYCDFVTSTTHKTMRGPRGGFILCKSQYAARIDKTIFPGTQGGPFMHTIAAKAVCFKEALDPSFRTYAHQIVKNASALADEMLSRGFRLVSGGTDNHLVLVDLRSKQITGVDAQILLGRVGITANKNMIPFETEKPTVTSGIRLGTPAMTTRGFVESDMREVARLIDEAIANRSDGTKLEKLRHQVLELCVAHPLYG